MRAKSILKYLCNVPWVGSRRLNTNGHHGYPACRHPPAALTARPTSASTLLPIFASMYAFPRPRAWPSYGHKNAG